MQAKTNNALTFVKRPHPTCIDCKVNSGPMRLDADGWRHTRRVHCKTRRAKQVPTSKANTAMIDALFHDKPFLNKIIYLYERWQDEKQYEDIADYGKALVAANVLPKAITLTKMNATPFGFDFTIGTDAAYRVFLTTKNCGWKRLK